MRVLTAGGGILGGLLLLALGIMMLVGILDFVVRIGGVLCVVVGLVIFVRAFMSRKREY